MTSSKALSKVMRYRFRLSSLRMLLDTLSSKTGKTATFGGRPPQDGVFFHEPRKGAVLVGGEQSGLEGPPNSQQSMLTCDIHRREMQIGIEHVDLHDTK